MHTAFQLRATSFVIIGLLFSLLATSCDSWQSITFVNQTPFPIKVDTRSVSLDYSDPPQRFTYDAPVLPIETGKSQRFLTPVSVGRSTGAKRKYTVVAVNEANEVLFSKVFTWDELHDMNWRVVIKATK